MDYELIRNRIEAITSRIKEIGGEVQEVIIDEPALLEQIFQTEEQLGAKLPESFKKVLKTSIGFVDNGDKFGKEMAVVLEI